MSDFTGSWAITIATPLGDQHAVLDIATRDGELTGYATQDGETVPFEDPLRMENRLTWTQRVSRPLKLTVHFDVTIEDDRIWGTAKAGIFPKTRVVGERVL